jgi:hypothetical protein
VPADVLVVTRLDWSRWGASSGEGIRESGLQTCCRKRRDDHGRAVGRSGWSYAEGAQHALMDSGVPEAQVIVATAGDVEPQRSFESARAMHTTETAGYLYEACFNSGQSSAHKKYALTVLLAIARRDEGR